MTITTDRPAVSDFDSNPTIEEWRDQMIELAHHAFTRYEWDNIFDEEAMVTVANAMHDIRVRDTLMWDILLLGNERMEIAFDAMSKTGKLMPLAQSVPLMTVAAILLASQGEPLMALMFSNEALRLDQSYSLAYLVNKTIQVAGEESAEIIGKMFSGLTRYQCRHGNK